MIQNHSAEPITTTPPTPPIHAIPRQAGDPIHGPGTKIKASTHLGITIRRAAPAAAGDPTKIASSDLEAGWSRC
jgi:hypothetical protein